MCLGVTLPMCLLFYHYIWQNSSEVVATLVIHIINQLVNGWRPTKSVLYVIQYVRLKYKYIEYQSSKYWCKFDSYLYSNKITSIKSDPFKNITKLYRLWIFLIFFTFYDLQYMYMYNVCCFRTIYQFTQNIKIPWQNKITFIILIKHTSKVQQVHIQGMHYMNSLSNTVVLKSYTN
jgi:hypothetical protein